MGICICERKCIKEEQMSQTHRTLFNVSVSPYGCITHSQDTAGVSKLEKLYSLGLILVYTVLEQLRKKQTPFICPSSAWCGFDKQTNKKMVTNLPLTDDQSDLMQYIGLPNRPSTGIFPFVLLLRLSPNVKNKGTECLTVDIQGLLTSHVGLSHSHKASCELLQNCSSHRLPPPPFCSR